MIRRDRVRRPRRKVCQCCVDHVDTIDYKNVAALRRFVSERGKILPRRVTGTCAKHQRKINLAIKRARAIALLPFSADWLQSKPWSPMASRFFDAWNDIAVGKASHYTNVKLPEMIKWSVPGYQCRRSAVDWMAGQFCISMKMKYNSCISILMRTGTRLTANG